MRHSAPRSRVRWGRIVVAGLSSLTVGCSLLGAAGAFTFPPAPDRTVVSEDPAARTQTVAERAFEADSAAAEEGGAASGPTTDTPVPESDDAEPSAPPKTSAPVAAEDGATPSPDSSTRPPDPKKTPVSSYEEPLDLPADSGAGRRVVFSISQQYVWLVAADGSTERQYPVSGSRFDQLEPGDYEVIRKRRNTTSWHGTESMEYMVTFTFGENAAIGFHDIPRSLDTGELIQTLDQLGMALSDGCIRQRHADAAALWDFAPEDTPVIVLA